MLTLGTWLGPILAAVIAVTPLSAVLLREYLRRGQEIARQGIAIERLAAEAAQRYSAGYDHQYPEWHAYFTGNRADAEGIVNMESPVKGDAADHA
jgi:hypothetical protein